MQTEERQHAAVMIGRLLAAPNRCRFAQRDSRSGAHKRLRSGVNCVRL
jgi:hypothetical protein